MANQNRRLKRAIRKTVKNNREAEEPVKKAPREDLSELRTRREQVHREIDRLQNLPSPLTHYQQKRLLALNDEHERLAERLKEQ